MIMDKPSLLACYSRIKAHVVRTPVLSSAALDDFIGATLQFKCENFQAMGAYKIRGAVNALLQLSPEAISRGVVTHSSGNFAQALALAARNLGAKATIVMPRTASEFKKRAVLEYGGTIVECDPDHEAREETAAKIRSDYGATFIHPSNDLQVILGQGTACMELLEDYPELTDILVPVGGGGLLAGTALAANFFGSEGCKVYAGEPHEADDAYRSYYSGTLQGNTSTNTIADGLKTMLGDTSFPIIQKYAHGIIRVTEKEIVAAMRMLWERLKITAEPSSAVALAALINKREDFAGRRIGIIVSGGNVDLNQLPF
jgi:threonine dehydratase